MQIKKTRITHDPNLNLPQTKLPKQLDLKSITTHMVIWCSIFYFQIVAKDDVLSFNNFFLKYSIV